MMIVNVRKLNVEPRLKSNNNRINKCGMFFLKSIEDRYE